MKYLLLLSLLCFSPDASALIGHAALGTPTTGSPIANGTVLATTGSLVSGSINASPSGNYQVQIMISSSVAATFDFQSLFNGSVVSHIYIMVPASSSFNFESRISFSVPDGITLQVVNVGAITGTVQANLFWAVETLN